HTRSKRDWSSDVCSSDLHPIMPFVTEEIWTKLPHQGKSLVVAQYPVVHPEFNDSKAAKGMEVLTDVIRSVRNIRAEVNTPLSKPIILLIQTSDQVIEDFLSENRNYLDRFCNPETLVISSEIKAPELAMSQILTGVNIHLPLAGLIDVKAEVARLEKELAKWDQEVKRVTGKLSNERFVANAPAAIVQKERDKQADYLEKQKAVKDRILQLKNI